MELRAENSLQSWTTRAMTSIDPQLMEELEIKSMTVDRTSRLSETFIYLLLLCPPLPPSCSLELPLVSIKTLLSRSVGRPGDSASFDKMWKKEKSGKKRVDFTLSASNSVNSIWNIRKGKVLFESTLDILPPSRSTRFEQILFFPFLMVLCSQPQSPSNYLSWSSPESMSPNKIRAEILAHFWSYSLL